MAAAAGAGACGDVGALCPAAGGDPLTAPTSTTWTGRCPSCGGDAEWTQTLVQLTCIAHRFEYAVRCVACDGPREALSATVSDENPLPGIRGG